MDKQEFLLFNSEGWQAIMGWLIMWVADRFMDIYSEDVACHDVELARFGEFRLLLSADQQEHHIHRVKKTNFLNPHTAIIRNQEHF
jgi:hypothetical protein